MNTKINCFAIIFCLIIPLLVSAQDKKIDGFLNFKWGTAASVIKKDMPAKISGVRFVKQEKGKIEFEGVTYKGVKVKKWQFEFFENKLCNVEVDYVPANDMAESRVMLNKIEKAISSEYFKSGSTMRDDGGSYFWIEKNVNEEAEEIISLTWEFSTPEITLAFTHYPLYKKILEAEDKK